MAFYIEKWSKKNVDESSTPVTSRERFRETDIGKAFEL
ncbi:MAG: hypothetical protein RJA33_25 [Actinomycetota bacterium]|jgi:hypothetical protein